MATAANDVVGKTGAVLIGFIGIAVLALLIWFFYPKQAPLPLDQKISLQSCERVGLEDLHVIQSAVIKRVFQQVGQALNIQNAGECVVLVPASSVQGANNPYLPQSELVKVFGMALDATEGSQIFFVEVKAPNVRYVLAGIESGNDGTTTAGVIEMLKGIGISESFVFEEFRVFIAEKE